MHEVQKIFAVTDTMARCTVHFVIIKNLACMQPFEQLFANYSKRSRMIESYWLDATLSVALFFTTGVITNVEDSRQPLEATKAISNA